MIYVSSIYFILFMLVVFVLYGIKPMLKLWEQPPTAIDLLRLSLAAAAFTSLLHSYTRGSESGVVWDVALRDDFFSGAVNYCRGLAYVTLFVIIELMRRGRLK